MRNTIITAHFVDSQTIQLRLELGTVIEGVQTTVFPAGVDPTVETDWVYRDVDGDGDVEPIGRVAGNGQFWAPVDTLAGSDIADLFRVNGTGAAAQALVDALSRWSVTVDGVAVGIDSISRKTNILDTAQIADFGFEFTTLENVFIHLDAPMTVGDQISIGFNDPQFAPQVVTYAPSTVISEAIHVNLVGFDPDDAHKVAYLSSWDGFDTTGAGAGVAHEFAPGTVFRVINEATGAVAFTGVTTLYQDQSTLSDFELNFQQTDTWAMDFSSLNANGRFHIEVAGVGRSNSFDLSEDHWAGIYDLSVRGFYHQRSGIALEEPYTDWTRPRDLHPDDGVLVYETTVKITDTSMGYDLGQPDPFGQFGTAMTGKVLTNAWGGWHDAGDFDRRTPHLEAARKLIELWETNPDFFEARNSNIPESGNTIPDLLDEAIWTMDLFRRLQHADGGVPGGIESEEHPRFGDGSWGESLRVFAYAPDAWTSFEYAASAAKISQALERYDATAAAEWLASALKAMDWAQDNRPTGAGYEANHQRAENIAAAELFRATGDAQWHQTYLETTQYDRPIAEIAWFEHQYEAAFVYAQTTGANAALQQAGIAELLAEGQRLAESYGAGGTGFGASMNPYAPYGGGFNAQGLEEASNFYARLHALTGDAAWLIKMQQDAQTLLGTNPLNMAFLTGIDGVRSPEVILNLDALTQGLPPPPGITIYGDNSVRDIGFNWYHEIMQASVWPNFYQTPVSESYQGFSFFVPSAEYTVMQGMIATTYVAGYLAQAGAGTGDDPAGPTVIEGSNRADTLGGTIGDDVFNGRDGNDRFAAGTGNDLIFLNDGNDTAFGLGGNDGIAGGRGNDLIYGGEGNDVLSGDDGSDIMFGGSGQDRVVGGNGANVLSGMSGADILVGGDEADRLYGGTGNDLLDGAAGHDLLNGDDGADTLLGGAGNDTLAGSIGNDLLDGAAGADRLHGGNGTDLLTGGAGADMFVFDLGSDTDQVTDFVAGVDKLRLSDALWSGLLTSAQVIETYATLASGGRVMFDFGDGDMVMIRVAGLAGLGSLAGDIVIF